MNSSANIDAAMTQWNSRAASECRGNARGQLRRRRQAEASADELLFLGEVPDVDGVHDRNAGPAMSATQIRNHAMWMGTFCPTDWSPTL